ncbi:glycosyl transferase, group 1 [Leptolyngbya sp. FACHB-17]|uniref:glycosyl transferase, group 1 n=1 Tax=unclassified Leptolyngbya TaxID=2650499 RepID=UPI001681A171|nr:glycosyl transferase, group 1 [Leptolyngbya sp. FACHB-17]MBD2082338.1 glycosyl transferase, group 1 [Leptolyngbya sp. FACHB-17]
MSKRIVCTTTTKNHLAYARTLAETLLEHNSDAELYVLLADRLDDAFDPDCESFKLISLEELPDQHLVEQMTFYYTPFELCCALRGVLHQYIYETLAPESWIFLDSDVMVCHSLEAIFEQLSQVSILLSPHVTTPISLDRAPNLEVTLLRGGTYNGGFLGLRRTDEAYRFINWWKTRLAYYGFADPQVSDPRGLFVDQLWLNLAPVYFQDFGILWHPGANIGHWNFYERQFERDPNGNVLVNDQPLLFLHFSGWDLFNPYQVSKYSLLAYEEQFNSPWGKMAKLYREKLLKNGYEATTSLPYAFATFQNGTPIDWVTRRGYYEELRRGTEADGSPFDHPEYAQTLSYRPNSTQFLAAQLHQTEQTVHQLQTQVEQAEATIAQHQQTIAQQQQTIEQAEATIAQQQQTIEQAEATIAQQQQTIEQQQQQIHEKDGMLDQIQLRLQAIENSKFWQFRNLWWKLRRSLGQSDTLAQ